MEKLMKTEQLYEGKAKKVYATNNPEFVIVDYKDDATAFNGEKKGAIHNKRIINNLVTNHMMQLLEKEGIPTHFVEEISDRETVVKKVGIIPFVFGFVGLNLVNLTSGNCLDRHIGKGGFG